MAANRIKGITVEIGGDTTKLQTALKGVNSTIRDTQSQLKDVEKLLKLDPGNTELMAQKHRLLGDAVAGTREKLETLKTAAEQANAALANGEISQSQYDALQREIIETEQHLRDLEQQAANSSVALQKLGAAGGTLQNVGDKISGVGQALMPLSAALTGIGAAGVASFADVDKTMQLTYKTMGATAEEAEILSKSMKDAAAQSVFGMKDAAEATLNFARSGLKAEAAAATLAPAMNLAAGEGGDLNTVSAGLVATINSFGDSFDNASHYADVFAAGCNNSALEINSLSSSMSIAAPVFSAAGYEIEDTVLALGLMSKKGIEANVAATSLKTGLARLITPSKDGADALSNLGFAVRDLDEQEKMLRLAEEKLEEKTANLTAKQLKYAEAAAKHGEGSSQAAAASAALVKAEHDVAEQQSAVNLLMQEAAEGTSSYGFLMVDSEGNMRPFVDVLKDLQGAFSELSENEQIAAASAIFGKNQMTPWLSMLTSAPEVIDELNNSLRDCAGTTQEMADAMMSGTGGGIEQLKSSIDVLVYSIVESLAPVVQSIVDKLQGFVTWLNSLDEGTRNTIVRIGLFVAALGPALIAIGALTSGVGGALVAISGLPGQIVAAKTALAGVSGAFASFSGAIAGIIPSIGGFLAALAPIAVPVAIVAGITALVVGIKRLWDTNENFRNAVTEIWEKIKSAVSTGVEGIKKALSSAAESVKSGVERIKGFFSGLAEAFVGIRDSIAGTFQSIGDKIKDIWQGFLDTFGPLLDAFAYLFETIFQAIGILATRWFESVKEDLEEIWTGIVDFFTPALELFHGLFSSAWENIHTAVTTITEKVGGFLSSKWEEIKSDASAFAESVSNKISTKWDEMKADVEERTNRISSSVSSAWEEMRESVSRHTEGIRTAVSDGLTKAVNFVTDLVDEAKEWGADLVSNLIQGIKDKVSDLAGAVRGVADKIREYLHFSKPDKGPLADIDKWMPDMMRLLADGIEKGRGDVRDAIDGVAEDVASADMFGWMGDTLSSAKNSVSAVIKSIGGELSAGLMEIEENIDSITGSIVNTVGTKLQMLEDAVSATRKRIADGASGVELVSGDISEALSKGMAAQGNNGDVAKYLKSVGGDVGKGLMNIEENVDSITGSIVNTVDIKLKMIEEDVTTTHSRISETMAQAWTDISTRTTDILKSLIASVNTLFDRLYEDVTNSAALVCTSVLEIVNAAADVIRDLVDEAETWGADIMLNLIHGMQKMEARLKAEAWRVADMIDKILGCSVPEEGPMSKLDTWMPDMMKELAQGIEKSRYLVQDAISNVASDLVLSPSQSVNRTTVSHTGTIRVEGVNSSGEFGDVVDIVIERLREEARV